MDRKLSIASLIVGAGVVAGVAFAAGLLLARTQPVLAVSSLADGSFAVCTAPLDDGIEGFFMLDFETGDLTGGALMPANQKFGVGYRHNVLKDLNVKAGKTKNAKFLLVSGGMAFNGAGALAPSVLYVTDASTGVTAAYGIPWGPGMAGRQSPLMPLDRANARGGGEKVP
jgi:hypothetical protein